MRRFKELFIGNKQFYKMILLIAVPIMVQNGITNFVNLLDNIMVGRVGTEQMSGVAIVNQLVMVFNVCMFGCVSGAGIFGAQFYGKGDYKGVQHTFHFKLYTGLALALFWIVVFYIGRDSLIHLFLHEGSGTVGDLETTYRYGEEYLKIILVGLVPTTLTQIYASTLRETGETLMPMKAGIGAVLINLVFDYLLIFGTKSIPAMGVSGAAIATVLARFVECLCVMIWTHTHTEKNRFIVGAYREFKIPAALTKQIILKGTPLLLNETMWSMGMAILTQCYSTRGLAVVAGLNISTTVSNLFNIVFLALGSAISIVVGQLLGAGKLEEAVDTDRKMIFFSVVCCIGIGFVMFLIAPLFPRIYNTSEIVRTYASRFIMVAALCMPMYSFVHATYFTLRSGGKTVITFLFDSVYVWVVTIPLAYALTRFTNIDIIVIYICCQLVDLIKCAIGFVLVKKRVWVHNMTIE